MTEVGLSDSGMKISIDGEETGLPAKRISDGVHAATAIFQQDLEEARVSLSRQGSLTVCRVTVHGPGLPGQMAVECLAAEPEVALDRAVNWLRVGSAARSATRQRVAADFSEPPSLRGSAPTSRSGR